MVYKDHTLTSTRHHRRAIVLLVLALALAATTLVALASTPLGVAGYLDFSYAGNNNTILEPSGNSAESKLWWHDGYWWGVLYSRDDNTFNIHRLDPASQDWVDTGVLVDDRVGDPVGTGANDQAARADALWDASAGKLYIATHRRSADPNVNIDAHAARLMVYSYDDTGNTWTLDGGFPAVINQDITEALVLDKDNTGRLWITYVSRFEGQYYVFVNASTPGNPAVWGEPFILPVGDAAQVNATGDKDISALLAFDGGSKIGVMWSNQRTGFQNFYLAVRAAGGDDPAAGWALEPALTEAIPSISDDHINMKVAPDGSLLAVVKTGATTAAEPLIGVVHRVAADNYTFHTVAMGDTQDTRPLLVVDAASDEAVVFRVSKTDGGNVCSQRAPLATLAFTPDNCAPPPTLTCDVAPELVALGVAAAPVFIGDTTTYCNINDPTSTKQMATEETGIVVLASDEVEQVYVHNGVGGTQPPPPPPGDFSLYLPVVRN